MTRIDSSTTSDTHHGGDAREPDLLSRDAAYRSPRVVLVGPTGLEAPLSAIADGRVVAVRNVLEGIAETAAIASELEPEDFRAVVFGREALRSPGIDDDVEAVRLVDPSVLVLAVEAQEIDGPDDLRSLFDGVLPAGGDEEAVATAIFGLESDADADPDADLDINGADGLLDSAGLPDDSATGTQPTPGTASPHQETDQHTGQQPDQHAGQHAGPNAHQPVVEASGPPAVPPLDSQPHHEPASGSPDESPSSEPLVRTRRRGPTEAPSSRAVRGETPASRDNTPLASTQAKGAAQPSALDPAAGHDTATDPASSTAESAADTPSGADPIGDRPMLEAMLAGGDVVGPGLQLIRARLGHAEVAFVPAVIDSTGNAEPVPAASARTAIAVDVCAEPPGSGRHAAAAGSVLEGRLVLPAEAVPQENTGATRDAMAAHAAWLAAWMRLSGQNRALRRAAFTDPLTGAWNRRYSSRFLHAAVEKARVARRSLTVLYFDIDGFKRYNDDYGHAAGDEILVEVVRALRAVVRPSDRVCRVGGDEFVVIFYEPDGPRRVDSKPPESVYVLTKRVQQQIRERKFPKLGHEAAGRLTISGGLATYPWDGADAESLLHAADELAIRSKRQGKNAITLGPGAERVCGQPPRA